MEKNRSYTVAILVPIYNVEDHIVQCARSLFEQSYDDCRFIFVDDCSTDCSVERLERIIEDEYSSLRPKIQIIRHRCNRGVAEARNTAMECAISDFILFVDSDDWCERNMVSRLVREQKRNDADIVSSDYMHICGAKKRQVRTHWVGGREGSLRIVLAQSFALPNRVWSLLMRNKMLYNNGIRFESGVSYGEDSLFLVQILYYAREVGHVDRPLYNYRADSAGSYSNNESRSSMRNYIRSQRLIYQFMVERDAAIRYGLSLVLGRLNLRRWLIRRNHPKNPLGVLYRLGCYILNRAWTLRCWLLS